MSLLEPDSSSSDVIVQAVTAFRVRCVSCQCVLTSHSLQRAADDEGNTAFEEARQTFLQTCEKVVFANEWDSEPPGPSLNLLSARILHRHTIFFRSCLPYAESHRANSLVFCLLRRLNAYQISQVLSTPSNVDALGPKAVNSRLSSLLSDSDHMCLRSIVIAATMNSEQTNLALNEMSLQGPCLSPVHSPPLLSANTFMDASLSNFVVRPSERYEQVSMTPSSSARPSSTMEGLLSSSVTMSGLHLLTCNSHIVATLTATILPANSHAKCLTAAMLLLHVVAGFCPHLFKPPSMSQPLGMIELANRTIMAVMSSGSYDAICQRLLPLTDALHVDHKLLFSNLIFHTMQFVCDIFLMRMVSAWGWSHRHYVVFVCLFINPSCV